MPTASVRSYFANRFKNSTRMLFVVGCAALTVTSCSGGSSDAGTKPTPASEKPAPSKSADPEAATKQEVLAAYNNYWAEQVKAFSKGSEKGTDLKKYATLDALGHARANLIRLNSAGNITKGAPKHDAEVTALGLNKKTPDATITDCLDIRPWQTVNRKTGKLLKPPRESLSRYITIVSAQKWDNGWMITKAEPQERKC